MQFEGLGMLKGVSLGRTKIFGFRYNLVVGKDNVLSKNLYLKIEARLETF